MNRLSYKNKQKIKENNNEIFFKGDNILNIRVEKLEKDLEQLKKVKDLEITELREPYKSMMKKIIDMVYILVDTEAYKEFYTLVEKVFNDVTEVKPKTVGAYFIGCNIKTSFDRETPAASCSLICAGSLPRPGSWKYCNSTILWGVFTNNEFKFVELSQHDNDEVIIFTNFNTYDNFPGFSIDEKIKLRNQHSVNKIRLVSYDNKCKEYMDLIGSPIELSKIKNRNEKNINDTNNEKNKDKPKDITNNTTSSSNILIYILFLVILLILLFCLYYFMKNRNSEEKHKLEKNKK